VSAALLGAGILIIVVTAYDLFQSVVLPRPAVGRVRFSPLVLHWLWLIWRLGGRRIEPVRRREAFLGAFAPLAVLVLLILWAAALVLGYALMLMAVENLRLGSALYLSASSLLTIGVATPAGGAGHAIIAIEAANGLGVIALVVSLLFLLFGAFERREVQVIELDTSAGAPPSGVALLESCAGLELPEHLAATFTTWRTWAAQVLESHLAFPVLVYFRSSHDNEAWLNSFGAVMDAANLVLTSLEEGPHGEATMFYKVGKHLVDDIGYYFHFRRMRRPGMEKWELGQVLDRLRAAGYRARPLDEAWPAFAARRLQYVPLLDHLSRYLAIPPAPWIGDRSYVPHLDGAGTDPVDVASNRSE
jgi:hypothetical protein